MDVIIAARLSRKQRNGQEGLGLETQDSRSTDFAVRNGHDVVAVVADTKSGTVPPSERPNLKKWMTDPDFMRRYQGIVAYKTDRLSRGTDSDFSQIEAWAATNGKTLIIVNDLDGIHFPSRGDSDYWQWASTKREARREWESIQERNVRNQSEIKSRGFLVGAYPWGYGTVGEKYAKTLAPNELGEKYVPQVFQRVIDGESLESIGNWLLSEGIKTLQGKIWSTLTLSRMIRNTTYKGQHRDSKGKLLFKCPALVDADVWRRANDGLSSRSKRGRPNPKAMLTGSLYCMNCGARMYMLTGYRDWRYYRCAGTGKGTLRQSCGNMLRMETLDRFVNKYMSAQHAAVPKRVVIKGTDHKAELEEINDQLRDLSNQDLGWEAEDTERARLRAEYKRVDGLRVEPDRIKVIRTNVTYAGQWATLTDQDKGKWLDSNGIKIYVLKGNEAETILAGDYVKFTRQGAKTPLRLGSDGKPNPMAEVLSSEQTKYATFHDVDGLRVMLNPDPGAVIADAIVDALDMAEEIVREA